MKKIKSLTNAFITILFIITCSNMSSQTVQNGSFETFTQPAPPATFPDKFHIDPVGFFNNLQNWSRSHGTPYNYTNTSPTCIPIFNGSRVLSVHCFPNINDVGSYNLSNGVFQNVNLIPGRTYRLTARATNTSCLSHVQSGCRLNFYLTTGLSATAATVSTPFCEANPSVSKYLIDNSFIYSMNSYQLITKDFVCPSGFNQLWIYPSGDGSYSVPASTKGPVTNMYLIDDVAINEITTPPSNECAENCFWKLKGNSNTTSPVYTNYGSPITGGNFIGSIGFAPFAIATNNRERMRVNANGFVGIGRANPSGALHVQSSGQYRGLGATVIQTGNGNAPGLILEESETPTSNSAAAAITAWSNALYFLTRSAGGNGLFSATDFRMTILNSNGNVGIGTTAPVQRLHVVGNIQANSTLYTSDLRYKNNIKNLVNQLDVLKKMNGKSYEWKTEEFEDKNFDNKLQFGFIAQEIESILPNIVHTDDEGFKSVNYTQLIPVLTEAIKELNAKVEKQNNAVIENEALKSELATVKDKLLNYDEKFALLENTITKLCENGCAGLEKIGTKTSSDVDVLYQSIPNPTDSEALVNYSLSKEYTNAYISVSTQEGKQLMSVKLDAKKGAGAIKLSLGELASGTYLYTLVAGERVIDTKRLQIVK